MRCVSKVIINLERGNLSGAGLLAFLRYLQFKSTQQLKADQSLDIFALCPSLLMKLS